MSYPGMPSQPPGGEPTPAMSFSPDAMAVGHVPLAAPLDPLTSAAARALELPPAQRTWIQSAILLAITLVLFAAAGAFQATPVNLLLIVAVLLLHESGHYLGMRLFNYQDVKMFFIPFFGAAVSGRSTSVEGYKEAIVLLLGPLPGIVLGLILGAICVFYDNALLRTAATMLIGINGFNLLPLMPLDGGRLIHLIVFSRQRHIEAVFRVLTALLLGLLAWAISAWLLAIPAFFLLISTQANFQVSRLAQQLRGAFHPGAATNLAAPIPREWALALIERVRVVFPQVLQPAALANLARQVWERIHLRPPGFIASVLLLGLYGGTFCATPIALIAFQVPIPSNEPVPQPDGSLKQARVVRTWGRVQSSTELNDRNQRDGRHVEYFPYSGQVKVDGAYADGLQDGVWTTYREDGQVESQEEYRQGVLVEPQAPE
jgi:Zn-dependent protease